MARDPARPDVPDMEAVYDKIAEAWTRTRSGAWPAVCRFLGAVERGSLLADVGAGSGRYFDVEEARGLRIVGLDFSHGQLVVARRVHGERVRLVRADARAVPLKDACADAALHIAVLHHLFHRSDRILSLRELYRILRPGGRAFASSWAESASVLSAARRLEGGGPRDLLVPFKEKLDKPAERFFHAYERGELEDELRDAGFSRVKEWLEEDNWFAEVTR